MSKQIYPPAALVIDFRCFISAYAWNHPTYNFELLKADIEDLNLLFTAFECGKLKAAGLLLRSLLWSVRDQIPKGVLEYIYANS